MHLTGLSFLVLISITIASCTDNDSNVAATDQHTFASCDKNFVKISNKISKLQTPDAMRTFPNCIKLLWDDVRMKEHRQSISEFNDIFIRDRKNHTPEYAYENSEILLHFFPENKNLKQIYRTSSKKAKQKAHTASNDIWQSSANTSPRDVKIPMNFIECHEQAYKRAKALGIPYNASVNTDILFVIKVPTSEGSVILTCSQLDKQMTITTHYY